MQQPFASNLVEPFTRIDSLPLHPFRIRQNLANLPLFEERSVRRVLESMPSDRVEIRRPLLANAEERGISGYDRTEQIGSYSPGKAFDRLAVEPLWINAHRVHEHDSRFAEITRDYLTAIARCCGEMGNEVYDFTCDLILSSPNAVVHFHSDPDQSFLNQLRGTKTVYHYPAAILPEEQIELLSRTEDHGATPFRPEYEKSLLEPMNIGPGDAVFLPLYAPHRVTNGPEVCWSLSFGFHTRSSLSRKNTHLFNSRMRARGLRVSRYGTHPLRDRGKAVVFAAGKSLRGTSRNEIRSLSI